jgi:hypothetical protein
VLNPLRGGLQVQVCLVLHCPVFDQDTSLFLIPSASHGCNCGVGCICEVGQVRRKHRVERAGGIGGRVSCASLTEHLLPDVHILQQSGQLSEVPAFHHRHIVGDLLIEVVNHLNVALHLKHRFDKVGGIEHNVGVSSGGQQHQACYADDENSFLRSIHGNLLSLFG